MQCKVLQSSVNTSVKSMVLLPCLVGPVPVRQEHHTFDNYVIEPYLLWISQSRLQFVPVPLLPVPAQTATVKSMMRLLLATPTWCEHHTFDNVVVVQAGMEREGRAQVATYFVIRILSMMPCRAGSGPAGRGKSITLLSKVWCACCLLPQRGASITL